MKRSLVFVFGFVCLTGAAVWAADEMPAAEKKPDAAQMEKMKTMMAPSDAHKVLEPLAGQWIYKSKFWMSPDGKVEESSGTSDNEMIYGGRFLKQITKGVWMGESFEGLGYTGYDNIKGEYETVWVDSMATGMMKIAGSYDAASKTLNQSGANSCPMTGNKAMPLRSEWKIVDNDHNVYSSYMTGPDGKEAKGMEIEFTRVV